MSTDIEVCDVGYRMQTVVSNCYVCPRCEIFCMETKPCFKRGGAAKYVHVHRKLPQAKIWCKNGCHTQERWGWWDIQDERLKGKHIPKGIF